MTFPEQIATAQGTAAGMTVHLRVLATTDLHAHLLPFDYFTDRRDNSVGLAQLEELINAARAAAKNVLLLDNGDTLQGAPLADAAVAEIVPAGRLHPMIVAMNALGYDAATLGNHDFDFGLPHLSASLEGAAFPIVSANVHCTAGYGFVPPRCVLTREVTDSVGEVHRLRIGITGGVPPQVAQWNKPHLQNCMAVDDMLAALRGEVAALREEGVDIVLALAHSGYGHLDAKAGAENVALQVAQIAGVDGVVAGHTHKVRADATDLAPEGTYAPIVQPGAYGSHLGCIDLVLDRADGNGPWRVRQSSAANFSSKQKRALGVETRARIFADNPELRQQIAVEHRATRAYVARFLGASEVPLETFFSVIAPCAATQVIADAQWDMAKPLIAADPSLAQLPVLSAVAPFKAGGRSGPRSYTDVPAGPLRLRHAADLYAYPNMLSVLRLTGQEVSEWLERSASLFRQILPDELGLQPLIDHDFAPYNFDRIAGLRYQIDVSRPARTNADGDEVFETTGRIRNLCLADGSPLDPRDEVLVITNSYRAAGGGHMHAAEKAEEVISARLSIREAVASYIINSAGPLNPMVEQTFSFTPVAGAQVLFETGPGALAHAARCASLGLTPLGLAETGFQQFSMTLS